MTEQAPHEPQQTAVWYFIAATFIFAAPSLFLQDAPLWARIALLVVGLVVVAGGGVQLGRETRGRRERRERSGDDDHGQLRP